MEAFILLTLAMVFVGMVIGVVCEGASDGASLHDLYTPPPLPPGTVLVNTSAVRCPCRATTADPGTIIATVLNYTPADYIPDGEWPIHGHTPVSIHAMPGTLHRCSDIDAPDPHRGRYFIDPDRQHMDWRRPTPGEWLTMMEATNAEAL